MRKAHACAKHKIVTLRVTMINRFAVKIEYFKSMHACAKHKIKGEALACLKKKWFLKEKHITLCLCEAQASGFLLKSE